MPPTGARWNASSRILAESLQAPDEPLALLVAGGVERSPREVCNAAARALLDLTVQAPASPAWLLPHQVPAYERLCAILQRFGGGLLADAAGLGKSYVALAVARTTPGPVILIVPAVLVRQWKVLARRFGLSPDIFTHERLSRGAAPTVAGIADPAPLLVVDEAHRFRNPGTRRYHTLAGLAIGARVLLVTATPVHNRLADLIHLLRLFLRDDALVALGVPSLSRAARVGDEDGATRTALVRLAVARSRRRAVTPASIAGFPLRRRATTLRAAPVEPVRVAGIIRHIRRLGIPGAAGPLVRLTLLHRFASSLEALRHSLHRYESFHAMALEAGRARRRLRAGDFRRLFPTAEEADLQLAFLPLLLDADGPLPQDPGQLTLVRHFLEQLQPGPDPKAERLALLLADRPGKTIVFTNAAATARHLRTRLVGRCRVGAVVGTRGWLGRDRVSRHDVLAAFAPRAMGVPPPPAAAVADVLITTDLLSEGLNLQDAERVVHYDLPWSPARLAQRVGRIDRLGSRHGYIEAVTFLPPAELALALAIESRLATKVSAQLSAGAAEVETVRGPLDAAAPLDWCDRLQQLVSIPPRQAPSGAAVAVAADREACVLVVRFGTLVDVIVVEDGGVTVDPERATILLECAAAADSFPMDRSALQAAIRAAAPLVRQRLAQIATARWRATDRDRLGRRLVPLVLVSARKAARTGQRERLTRLDGLVDRLSRGLTAGEESQLEELVERPAVLDVGALLQWHERLPPIPPAPDPPIPELVAAVLLAPSFGQPRQPSP